MCNSELEAGECRIGAQSIQKGFRNLAALCRNVRSNGKSAKNCSRMLSRAAAFHLPRGTQSHWRRRYTGRSRVGPGSPFQCVPSPWLSPSVMMAISQDFALFCLSDYRPLARHQQRHVNSKCLIHKHRLTHCVPLGAFVPVGYLHGKERPIDHSRFPALNFCYYCTKQSLLLGKQSFTGRICKRSREAIT